MCVCVYIYLSSIFMTRCGSILPPSLVYPTTSLKKIVTHSLLSGSTLRPSISALAT